ncbi:uncharacterized protein LOC114714414 [Neltuma alba]|uniref:uncharacterized protein LOC114714414 n=1 Tax=Neltuma alba TaxID=207710 RepID=UPI0010A39008|nr:uncharacterized protein LOC114714414 [Prosopis alba]
MRSKSYHGFAMLLKMLNATSQANQELTFFMPDDREFQHPPLQHRIEEFLLSHAMPCLCISVTDSFPYSYWHLVPSGIRNKMMRIHNRGRGAFFLNNAQVTTATFA